MIEIDHEHISIDTIDDFKKAKSMIIKNDKIYLFQNFKVENYWFQKLNNKCVLIAGPHTHWVDFF